MVSALKVSVAMLALAWTAIVQTAIAAEPVKLTVGYLHETKVIDIDKAPAGAIDDTVARKVAKDAGAPLPLGTIKAQDVAKAPK
ncbi:MAG: hypothetical protein H0V78_12725 [Burkholderiales bacterium]|nr:hypothetical protein [Burkholderiales bacterium]